MIQIAYLVWDPQPGMFDWNLPLLNRPILWYGFFFALGFFLGYLVLLSLLRRFLPSAIPRLPFAEQLTLYVSLGGLIGARLGDVLLYQGIWHLFNQPSSLFAIWEGGLASHGGGAGIIVAMIIFSKKYKMSLWRLLDWVVIPAALAGGCIRIGNFFNQEILGIPTTQPWGILFLHPMDGGPVVPRHPVQLYEAFGYLCVFFGLFFYSRTRSLFEIPGKITGLFLLSVFIIRIGAECIKMEQSSWWPVSAWLTMGQVLSIPFLGLGLYLFFRSSPSLLRALNQRAQVEE